MCQACFDDDRKKHVETINDLIGVIGSADLIDWRDGYQHVRDLKTGEPFDGNLCLCSIDLPGTLIHNGMMVWAGDGIPEYVFRRIPD